MGCIRPTAPYGTIRHNPASGRPGHADTDWIHSQCTVALYTYTAYSDCCYCRRLRLLLPAQYRPVPLCYCYSVYTYTIRYTYVYHMAMVYPGRNGLTAHACSDCSAITYQPDHCILYVRYCPLLCILTTEH